MLTPKTFKLLNKYFKIYQFPRSLPLRWNPEENRLEAQRVFSFRTLPGLALWIWTWINFTLCVYAVVMADESSSIVSYVINIMYGIGWLGCGIFSTAVFRNAETLCYVLNGYINVDQMAAKRYGLQTEPKGKWQLLDLILASTLPAIIAIGSAVCSLFLAYPGDGRYWLCHVLGRRPRPLEVLLWTPMEFLTNFCNMGHIFALIQTMILVCMVNNHWTQEMTKSKQEVHLRATSAFQSVKRSETELEPTEALKFYRILSVLNKAYNYVMADLPMLGLMTFMTLFHILTAFTTVKFAHVIPMPAFSLFPYMTLYCAVQDFVIFLPMGKVQDISQGFLLSWGQETALQRHLGFRRELRSLPPLCVMIGSVYQVHKTTVLFLLMGVSNAVINASLIF